LIDKEFVYSGARVSEICQLRSEDIIKIEQIWCMKLDPEAGSIKTSGSERIIPLHPALIEIGFLKFAAEAKSGPLFAALSPDKFGKRGGNGTKVNVNRHSLACGDFRQAQRLCRVGGC
jgi:integrase